MHIAQHSLTHTTTHLDLAISRYLDNRLRQWAEWYKRQGDGGQGYRKQTTEYNLSVYGTALYEAPGPKPLPSNSAIEEIEKAVVIMATESWQRDKYAEALREYYIKCKENKRKTAHAMGVSEAQFYVYFNGALAWLDGWFTGKYGKRYYK
jgi:hypothetical protein